METKPMSEPHDDDPEEQPRRRRRPLIVRLLGGFVVLNLLFALVSVGIALYIKFTHPSVGDVDSDEVDLVTIFDGVELRSRATSFRGGSWITMFGGGEIDLREAALDPSGATLRVTAIMGGGDVQVPDGWNVELTSKAIMGGVHTDRPAASDDPYAPTLRIEARAVMGGFGVTSGD
jgi:hypothetical protein